MVRISFLILICLFAQITLADIQFDYSMYNDQKKYECKFKHCYTLDEIIEKLKRDNYDVKDKLQTLIQVTQNMKVGRARMIPSLNLDMGMAVGFADFVAVPSLLGFLFPSNWFDWKESKLFYLANRQSYKTLLANQIVTGVELYFVLHQEFVETEIYSHYYKLLENIEKFIISEIKKKKTKLTKYHLLRLRTLKSSAKIKSIILENEFKDTFPLLADLMAMPIDNRWDQSSIVLHKLPTLCKYKKKDQNAYYKDVIKFSPEMKTYDYLLKAADYTKKSRMFAFLRPGASADENFGAGYFSQIKIAKSQKKQLEIRRDKTASHLKVSIHALVLNHNTAIETFKEAKIGRKNSKRLLAHIFKSYSSTRHIDIDELVDVISLALEFDLSRNFAQHYFFANKSKMDRYLFQGDYFSSLDSLIPTKQKLHSLASMSKHRENRKIRKALKSKKLKLEGDSF